MQRQLILILILLFALATAAALFVSQDQKMHNSAINKPKSLIDRPLSSQQEAGKAQIKKIVIVRAGETLLEATQIDGKWLAMHLQAERPFELEKQPLIDLVRSLSNANILEYKSAKKINHARLGLADINANNTVTSLVKFVSVDGREISLLIGKASALQGGQFVRYKQDDQMLLIDHSVAVPNNQFDWLRQDLFQFNVSKIVRVARSSATEIIANKTKTSAAKQDLVNVEPLWEIVAVQSGTQRKFTLGNINANEELVYADVLSNYIAALNDLSFTQARAVNTIEWASKQPLLSLSVQSTQGEMHHLDIVLENGKYLGLFSAEGEFSRLNSWVFTLPDYKVEALLKNRADFVK